MHPSEILSNVDKILESDQRHTRVGSPEFERQKVLERQLDERANNLYYRFLDLPYSEQSELGIEHDSYSPDGYVVHKWRVRTLKFTVDAPELEALVAPEGYKPVKTIELALYDSRGYKFHKKPETPTCALLTTISLQYVDNPDAGMSPYWAPKGIEFLECSSHAVFDNIRVLKPETEENMIKRRASIPRETIIAGMHAALDGLEGLLNSVDLQTAEKTV